VPISSRLLSDDEEVLVDLRPHWVFFTGPALLSAVAIGAAIAIATEFPGAPVAVAWLLAAMVALPVIWLLARIVRWATTSLIVTTNRVVLRRGVTSRRVAQVRLQRVTEVHTRQSLIQRVLGTGRVVIEVEGEDGAIVVDDVKRPRAFQRVLNHQLDRLAQGPEWANDDDVSPAASWAPVAGEPVVHLSYPGMATPPHGSPIITSMTAPSSVANQLIELDELFRRGLVTASEFQTKKAEILSRL
jgi:membrane protein YdbS with pleckstrin-like domain